MRAGEAGHVELTTPIEKANPLSFYPARRVISRTPPHPIHSGSVQTPSTSTACLASLAMRWAPSRSNRLDKSSDNL